MIIIAAFLFMLILDWIRLTMSIKEVLIWTIDILILPYYIVLILNNKHSFKAQFHGWVSFRRYSLYGRIIKWLVKHV